MNKLKGISCISIILMLYSCSNETGREQSDSNFSSQYVSNRQPLIENPYIELPLGSVKAKGWLEEMLLRQKSGATGHLDELYPLVMGKDNGWLGGDGDQWERGPYWIHGLITLAYTLDDQELIDKTTPWIEWILNSQKPDGYFGPDKDYPNLPGVQRDNAADWWPRMVAMKVLKQYYSATGDERVLDFLTNYFNYQLKTLPEKPLDYWTFWARYRGGDNLMIVYWLYNITGDKFLLDLAEIIHEQTFDFTHNLLETDIIRDLEPIHSVNLVQGIKEPALYYQQHPEEKYINSIIKGFDDLRKYSGQPQGLFGGDEVLRNNNPNYGVDVCTTVEFMRTLEIILSITGDVRFADQLEKVTYNALPSQISDDFINRQYYSSANQVSLSVNKYRNFSTIHSGTAPCFGLFTGYPCCTANMHQGWPVFTQNLWYATPEGGLAALLYAPSKVTAHVAGAKKITVTEKTRYPFEDTIRFEFTVEEEEGVPFPLDLRIPAWCEKANIKINGETYSAPAGNQVITISRAWENDDQVELILPLKITRRRWYENSTSIERGPITFVLKIDEDWKKIQNTSSPQYHGNHFYEVLPLTDWNYGLVYVPEEELNEVNVLYRKEQSMDNYPWNHENAPVELRLKARKIPGWKLYNETAGPLPFSLPYGHTYGEEETVTLIPYGCSTLRIAEFPVIGEYAVMK